jgi:hypothetical protein
MSSRPAAGGGRWVEVDPERLPGWLGGYGRRHGGYTVAEWVDGARAGSVAPGLSLVAVDGTVAECYPPPGARLPEAVESLGAVDALGVLLEATQEPRRIGLLLARQASVAVGVASGAELVSSKVDTSYVQGRTAAGGWSQQRYARRRANQAKAAATDAADVAVRVLLPGLDSLAALVTGGDHRAVDAVLADKRLEPLLPLRVERFLTVAEPRHIALEAAVRQARAVRIRVIDPVTATA